MHFDERLWAVEPLTAPTDGTLAKLVTLAQDEFYAGRIEAACAIARVARKHAPDESALRPLLGAASPWRRRWDLEPTDSLNYHLGLGDAYRILGEGETAASHYRSALEIDWKAPLAVRAHLGLSILRMPGDDYRVWLRRLYEFLEPETVVEIGVAKGSSLSLLTPHRRNWR
jgi:Flp pilus assembly protein TadD